MIGRPIFKVDDKVKFDISDGDKTLTLEGYVYIVDAYGTFEQNEEPSYDIMVEHSPHFDGQKCLYKHIREHSVSAL